MLLIVFLYFLRVWRGVFGNNTRSNIAHDKRLRTRPTCAGTLFHLKTRRQCPTVAQQKHMPLHANGHVRHLRRGIPTHNFRAILAPSCVSHPSFPAKYCQRYRATTQYACTPSCSTRSVCQPPLPPRGLSPRDNRC